MKQCSICDKDLPTPLDEYGSVLVPVCSQCWFAEIKCICEGGLILDCPDCIAGDGCFTCGGHGWIWCTNCSGTGQINVSRIERNQLEKMKLEYAGWFGELAS